MVSVLLQTQTHTRRNVRLAIQTASLGLEGFVKQLRIGLLNQEITLGEFYLAVYSIAIDVTGYVPHRPNLLESFLEDICPELAISLRENFDDTERLMIDSHVHMFGYAPFWLGSGEGVEVAA